MNFFLIGYRAVGKTSLGKMLAKKMCFDFIDTDEIIIKKENKTIDKIIKEKGWKYFRDKEEETIKKVSSLKKHIIATGGGSILRENNIKNMQQNGKIIWLKADIKTIESRIKQDKISQANRPALSNHNLIIEIEKTLNERYYIYKKIADFSFDTSKSSLEKLLDDIFIVTSKYFDI